MNQGDLVQERYRLDAALGKGGMAAVWLAVDDRLERPVAIKFLAPQFIEDPAFLVRFFAEAQSVARISHPNVVAVLDFGEFEDNPYLVMEYVPGGAVTELTGEPVELERAGRIVRDAALGAGAAHALGIVHRDIKPGNILLTENGMAKLADFGIALTAVSEKLTATGQVIGSPHYIAPEQASGRGARAESDVYALGIVLFELLTGKPPFDANNPIAIAIAHVDQAPEPPSTHVEDIPPEVDALVLRCLEKTPGARFRNGDQLAAALEEAFPSLEPALMRAAVASGAVAGDAFAGTAVANEVTSEREEVVAVPSARGRGRSALVVVGLIALAVLAGAAVWASANDDDEPARGPVAEEAVDAAKKRRPTASPTESDLAGAAPIAATPTPTATRDDGSSGNEGSGGGGSGGAAPGGSGGSGGSGGGGGSGGSGGGGSGGEGGKTSPTPEPSATPEPTPSG